MRRAHRRRAPRSCRLRSHEGRNRECRAPPHPSIVGSDEAARRTGRPAMSAPFEPTIIRASSLSTYNDCRRRAATRLIWPELVAAGYRLRHTERSIQAAIGTATHGGVGVVLSEKAVTGKLPPASVGTDAAVELLNEDIKRGVVFEGPRGTAHNRNIAERQAVRMTQTYHQKVAPLVRPLHVERRLEATVAPGVVLSGQSDLIANEPGQIRDLKTGAKSPPPAGAQVGAYALLAKTHNLDIKTAAIDF